MTPDVKRWLRYLFTVAVVAMLVLFARKVEWSDSWRTLRTADWTILLLAVIVNLLSAATKAVRWWIFLRPVGARSLGLAARASFAGMGLNNVLVANGGEAAKVVFVARGAHIPSATVLATVVVERMFEAIGYVVLLALSALVLQLPPSLAKTRPFALAALVGTALLLVYLIRHPGTAEAITPVRTRFMDRAKGYWTRFMGTLGGISTGPRFAGALAMSVLGWALQVATYHLTAMSAHMPISVAGTISALLAVNIGFALRATPGNVGVFQLMYAATAAFFGMDKNQAIAVAFLIQAQQIIPITLIGVALAPQFVFGKQRVTRAEDRGEVPVASRGD
ncbi:MAG: lysylphosphatidylglycerol synthase transmembrane domain-containing protein [Gemmatimonadaceae bacterium]